MANKTLKDYEELVREALKESGRYSKSLELQVYTLAGALLSLSMLNKSIEELDSCLLDSPQGKKIHPAFRARKEAEDSVTRQMKALGLTVEMLPTDNEDDPYVELAQKMYDASKTRSTIRPRK